MYIRLIAIANVKKEAEEVLNNILEEIKDYIVNKEVRQKILIRWIAYNNVKNFLT